MVRYKFFLTSAQFNNILVAKNCFNAARVQNAFQEANDRFKQLVVRYGGKNENNKKKTSKIIVHEVKS